MDLCKLLRSRGLSATHKTSRCLRRSLTTSGFSGAALGVASILKVSVSFVVDAVV